MKPIEPLAERLGDGTVLGPPKRVVEFTDDELDILLAFLVDAELPKCTAGDHSDPAHEQDGYCPTDEAAFDLAVDKMLAAREVEEMLYDSILERAASDE